MARARQSHALGDLFVRAQTAAIRLAGAETIRVAEFLPGPTALMKDDAGWYLDQEMQILIHETHWATLEALATGRAGTIPAAQVVEAVATVHHECSHALAPARVGPFLGYSAFRDGTRRREDRLAAFHLEEAVADVWTRHTLQQFILEAGVDRLDLRLRRCPYDVVYRDLVTVLETVLLEIGRLGGPSFYDLAQVLVREVPDSRARGLAGLVVEARRAAGQKANRSLGTRLASEVEAIFFEFDARAGGGEDVSATSCSRLAEILGRA